MRNAVFDPSYTGQILDRDCPGRGAGEQNKLKVSRGNESFAVMSSGARVNDD